MSQTQAIVPLLFRVFTNSWSDHFSDLLEDGGSSSPESLRISSKRSVDCIT